MSSLTVGGLRMRPALEGGGVSATRSVGHGQIHVLATTTAVGSDHTVSGLSSGMVLRATGPTTSAYGFLIAGDIPDLDASKIATGTLPVERGGTGVSSPTTGRILVGAGSSAMTQLDFGASGGYVRSTGTAWARSALLASDLTGTTLPASIVTSSLTAIGTIVTGVWNGTTIASVTQGAVTAHQAALTITESQITDGTILARVGGTETITGVWAFNGGVSGASAPFSVDSTFLVTNLNADLLDGNHANAFAAAAHTHVKTDITDTPWSADTDLSGTTLQTTVVTSSLTTIGTLIAGAVPAERVAAGTFGAGDYEFPANLTVAGQLVMSTTASQLVPGATSFAVRNNADDANNLLIADAGTATFRNNVVIPGTTTINTVAYTWPGGDGASRTRLTTDSAGNLSWATILLDDIGTPSADHTITMANKTVRWLFTNPAGGMLFEFTGAATDHSLEILQTGGNPGSDMHLLHIQASDTDPVLTHWRHGSSTSTVWAIDVQGGADITFQMTAAGVMEWGDGTNPPDTNFYRDGIGALKTDHSLEVAVDLTIGNDLLLASGSIIAWDTTDATLTHSAGKLTFGADGALELDFANHEMTNVDIDSGAIDGTVIGANDAAAASFTSVVVGTDPGGADLLRVGGTVFTAISATGSSVVGLSVENSAAAAAGSKAEIRLQPTSSTSLWQILAEQLSGDANDTSLMFTLSGFTNFLIFDKTTLSATFNTHILFENPRDIGDGAGNNPRDLYLNGDATIGDDIILNSAAAIIRFTGTNGGGNEGVSYVDAGGTGRFCLFFPGGDVVALGNRAVNGAVEIRANAAAGAGGEVTVAQFQDDRISFFGSNLRFDNTKGIQIKDAGGSYRGVFQLDGGDDLLVGSNAIDSIEFFVGTLGLALTLADITGAATFRGNVTCAALSVNSDDTPADGAIHFKERTADPGDPTEGNAVIWMSDGTGAGDDGDTMIMIQAGAVVKTATLIDFSAVDYVFDAAYRGDSSDAPFGFQLRTLPEMKGYTERWGHLPGMRTDPHHGKILEKLEESYLHLFTHEDRIGRLEDASVEQDLVGELTISEAGPVLRQLSVQHYVWKMGGERDFGLIAGPTNTLMHRAGIIDKMDEKGIAQRRISALLLLGWQDHERRLKDLEAECVTLRHQVRNLQLAA